MACQLTHVLLIWAAATSATPLPRTNQTATPLPRTNQTATPPPAWSDVSVQTTFGWLHGRLFERHAEFLGVPYATNERFEPAADWSEPFTPFLGRQATKAAPACPQAPGILPADDPTDEHCLFLNIFVPRSVVEAAKEGAPADTPIMLFFPGGAFIAGSASEGFDRDGWSGLGPYGVNLGYNASLMVADSGVIVVTANYRLGVLGFGAMPEDAAAGSSTGNFGLLDQRSSMRYVAAHIAAFGGDNKRVTIYGESAGAISVALHYVMPNSYNSGLFHGALSESGFTGAQNLQVALNRTGRVAQLLGCPVDSPKNCLKKADLGALVRAQKTVMPGDPLSGGGLEAWFPVIDGVEIIQEPFRSVYEGKFNSDIALLLGSNTDEGSLFVEMGHIFGVWGDSAFNTLANQTVNAATGIHHMNNSMLERARELYHPSSFWDNSARNAQLLTDYTFACGSRSLAQQVSQRGGAVYLYHFDYRPACDLLPVSGVYHTLELRFVFHAHSHDATCQFNEQEETLARDIGGMWAQFAATGNPVTPKQPQWVAYDSSSDQALRLSVGLLEMQPHYRTEYCDFWDSYYRTW